MMHYPVKQGMRLGVWLFRVTSTISRTIVHFGSSSRTGTTTAGPFCMPVHSAKCIHRHVVLLSRYNQHTNCASQVFQTLFLERLVFWSDLKRSNTQQDLILKCQM